MKRAMAVFAAVMALGLATVAVDAEAKRLGGGRSAGMQRQNVAPPANNSTAPAATPGAPAQTAPVAGNAAQAAAPAAAAATKRSWMGPIAGLAAGLGLAALASHLGFGEGLANMLMIGLLVMGVLMVVGMVMRKRAAASSPAMAGGGMFRTADDASPQNAANAATAGTPASGSLIGSRLGSGSPQHGNIPADFDTASFVRNAKEQFMGLQRANDARDIERLRDFLTPEMLELARTDLAERGDAPQATEVFGLEAQVLDVSQEADRYIVSVRFTGSTREQPAAPVEDLDEIWHLTKARAGFGGWMVAGIQQTSTGA